MSAVDGWCHPRGNRVATPGTLGSNHRRYNGLSRGDGDHRCAHLLLRVRSPTVARKTVAVEHGHRVRLRTVSPGDRAELAAGYRQLSERHRLPPVLHRPPRAHAAQLRFLTELDHHGHEAIGAEHPESGQGIGVARYVRSPADRTVAEVAVTVTDDWQGTGVGTALLDALAARGRAEDVTAFTAEILTENRAMSALSATLGSVAHEHSDDPGTTVARVDLR